MRAFCKYVRTQRQLGAWLITFAIIMKVLIPAGYMLNHGAGSLLMICPNANPGMTLDQLTHEGGAAGVGNQAVLSTPAASAHHHAMPEHTAQGTHTAHGAMASHSIHHHLDAGHDDHSMKQGASHPSASTHSHASTHTQAASGDHSQTANHDAHSGHDANSQCPYSIMPMAQLSGTDGVQLALGLAFILALGFAPVILPNLKPVAHLRPPLRGPPAYLQHI